MNRFFSKLDLRDIKIDPAGGSRFPPDADETPDEEEPKVPVHRADASPDAHAPSDGSADPGQHNGHVPHPYAAPVDAPPATAHPLSRSAGDADGAEAAQPLQVTETVTGTTAVQTLTSTAHEITYVPGDEGDVLKVSARSRPSAVAGAIAGVVREEGRAEVQAIGAGATNQAIKAVAIARDYLLETGIDVVCVPAFIDVTIENEDRTAIRLLIEPR